MCHKPRFLICLFILLGAACSEPPVPAIQGSTMGTTYSVNVPQLRIADRSAIEHQIESRLQQINRSMSTYQTDSFISRFNRSKSTGWYPVPESFAVVAAAALDVAERSGGAFDPTVGPLVDLWGFGAQSTGAVPTDEQVQQTKMVVGYQNLLVRQHPPAVRKQIPDLMIDFSAIAKGYAVDQIALLIEQYRYQNYLVEIGGELRASGHNHKSRPWKIGIEQPDVDGTTINSALFIGKGAVASSGDYRNFQVAEGRRYSHIIDPRTGYSVTHGTAAVTALAATAMYADAWSTALMVLGVTKGMNIAKENSLAVLMVTSADNKFSAHENEMFRQLKSAKQ